MAAERGRHASARPGDVAQESPDLCLPRCAQSPFKLYLDRGFAEAGTVLEGLVRARGGVGTSPIRRVAPTLRASSRPCLRSPSRSATRRAGPSEVARRAGAMWAWPARPRRHCAGRAAAVSLPGVPGREKGRARRPGGPGQCLAHVGRSMARMTASTTQSAHQRAADIAKTIKARSKFHSVRVPSAA